MGRRQRDYLHQRPGSSIWRLRLQIPGESDRVISLRTTDRIEAEILAMPLILEHKKRLWARANQRARRYMLVEAAPRMQPGDYPQPDGSRIHCTGNTILIFDAGGQFISQRPNAPQTSLTQDLDFAEISPSGAPMFELVDPEKPLFLAENLFTIHTRLKPKTNPAQADTALLELWIKVRNITRYEADKARETLALFHRLTNTTLAKATPLDALKLVEAKQAEGLKSATIQKHVGLLRSAINLSIKLGQFRNANPFTGIGNSDGKDKLDRCPFTEADMIYLRSRLGELKPELQLLWIVLATTGMRLSEAFEIKEEDIEGGVRFVTVGTKTPQSRRRVPVPADLEPYLPPTIAGPLFMGVSKIMGKDLNRFIRRVGIIDERKVLHSLRHRAASRLRAAKCPPDVRYQLLGHEITTVAEDYGEGFPVPILKEWIDKISW